MPGPDDRRLVREVLTATGEALWWGLRGEPVLPLHPRRPLHKILSRGGFFSEASGSPLILWGWLVRNLERLVEKLEYHEVCMGRVSVWVGYKNGRAGEGRASLEAPSDRFDVFLDVLRPCVRRAWIPRASASRIHLFAERPTPKLPSQLGLFNGPGGWAIDVANLKP